MDLLLIKSLWGMTGPLEVQFKKIAKAGYDGVEMVTPQKKDWDTVRALAEDHNLKLICQVFSFGKDVAGHVQGWRRQVDAAAQLNPLFINSQSAQDAMPWDDQVDCFTQMLAVENEVGVPIAHETHRGRATFTPWTTAALLDEFPDLKLTADISHWYCVLERPPMDQKDNIEKAMRRSIHLHGRVGHPEGPQVPDPRAPEVEGLVKSHEKFWDVTVEHARADGREYLTFTPEFGPPPYMPTLPYTNQPVSDLFDVCLWMGKRFKQRVEESAGR